MFDIIIKFYMERERIVLGKIGADNIKHKELKSWKVSSKITLGVGRRSANGTY